MEDFLKNQISFTNLTNMNTSQMFQHPMHPYHKYFAGIRSHNKELPFQLMNHLKAGRNKRAIQQIDRELRSSHHLVVRDNLRGLRSIISEMSSINNNRLSEVKSVAHRVKTLKKLKRSLVQQVTQKKIRRHLKHKYNSDISRLQQQLSVIDHKKHRRHQRAEYSEIPQRFQHIQFGGAIGNRIKKVASTTRKTISHYELEFHSENYRFDFSENRIKALIYLLNKSINERVEFYQQEINQAFAEHNHGIKIRERLFCLFEKVDTDKPETPTGFVVPKDDSTFAKMLDHLLLPSSDIAGMLQQSTHTFCDAVAESEMNASGYVFVCVLRMLIDVYMYKAPSGSNYIELPKEIENRKSTINIKNKDQECFKYCLYCHFEKNNLPYEYQNRKRTNESNKNITRNPSRFSNYDKYSYLDFSAIPFPVPLEETIISKVEQQNNLSINIYSLDQDENEKYHLAPERLSKTFCANNNHIDLLYLTNE